MPILEIRGLTKNFGGLAALDDLSLSINEGEIRGIIGPNGAGKTTLFNMISGVYKPTSGKIFYQKDMRIDGLATSRIAELGIVRTFQRTALYMDFTVLKNVTVARHLHGRENILNVFTGRGRKIERKNIEKAAEIVEFLGLDHLKEELAANLPHGHQRALGGGHRPGHRAQGPAFGRTADRHDPHGKVPDDRPDQKGERKGHHYFDGGA